MADEREHLLQLLDRLGPSDRSAVLAFAEFLNQRAGQWGGASRSVPPATAEPREQAPAPPVEEPADIPRPENESVVAAVKRLSRTYPMLEKREMLNETSALVAQHVMQGRDAMEVIDELEIIFQRRYEKLKAND